MLPFSYSLILKKMKRSGLLLLLSIFLFLPDAWSQPSLTGYAPIDPEIRTGKLDNGLTYYVRRNSEPEKRASFYIIQNVGAILEEDDQDGLAHFLEHMAFNGTANFPGKKIINTLERHGVAFGYNINAYTGFDETVYNLSDVPVSPPGLIDTCLLILHDWSHYISLDDNEIDKERGVIQEEYRTRMEAGRRLMFKIIPVVLKGSKYAERDIIGDMDIVRNFSYNTLRNYYNSWYRPDLQAIAVVGDIDPAEVERKIKTLFSKIPAPKNPPERPLYKVPYHEETYFVVAEDREAPRTTVSIIALHDAVDPEDKNLEYLRDNHIIALMNSMINTRIGELLQKPDPPFISGSISYGGYYAREYDAFSLNAVARKNEEAAALEGIYREAERAKKFGFTEGELSRAKSARLANFENNFRQKDKINNDTYIAGMQDHFLMNEPLTSMDFDYEFLKQVIDGITLEEVSDMFRKLMIDGNRTIVIQGLEGDDVKHLTETEALAVIDDVKTSELSPYEDTGVNESLISEDLNGSSIVKTKELPQFGAVEWTLGNNARVIYKRVAYEKDNVLLSAFSFGGISRVDESSLVLPANLLPGVVPMYGVGDYDNVTLQKMLAGKKANISLALSETAESVSGSSTPKDFETMMQLLYLRFSQPRFDSLAHKAVIDRYTAMVASMEKDPNKLKNDSISLIMTGYHPRTPVLTTEKVAEIKMNDIRKIYNDRFRGADEFTFFIVGNIGQDTVITMVEKYIGSIAPTGRKETWTDRDIEQPEGKITRKIDVPLALPKATVYLAFRSDMKYTPENYLGLEVINGILDIVYVETVREEEGGTYGVGVSLGAQKRPDEIGQALISFDCDPPRADDLKAIIYREINKMVQEGPSRQNLEKAVNNILKNREESKLHNSYWLGILSRYYSYGINSDDPANFENILKSMTVKDIRKIAGKMFKKADVVDLVFSPAQ
jgi:zinc protease